jgi:hypothetical protein
VKASFRLKPQLEKSDATLTDSLTELLRKGARELIAHAVESELELMLKKQAQNRLPDGRLAVVRNGYLPERTIQTGIGCFVQTLFPQLGVRTFSWTVYAAKFKLLRYSNGLIAPRDILILCSLYQCKYLFSISINSAMLTPNHFLL